MDKQIPVLNKDEFYSTYINEEKHEDVLNVVRLLNHIKTEGEWERWEVVPTDVSREDIQYEKFEYDFYLPNR